MSAAARSPGAPRYVIGVDVGTGSARAGLFEADGSLLADARRDISLWHDVPDYAEQSSAEIWRAVCACVRDVVQQAAVQPRAIAGIGFDATCSLVVLGEGGRSLPVGAHGDPARDIIVWMDHRALDQARRINETQHPVLSYVGGRISPEMQTPKLLWLKEQLPGAYHAAWRFFDLADFLTWRATGSLARSVCTVTCKWTYLAHERRWDPGYFRQIGLGDLTDDGFARIGDEIVPAGAPLGDGLTASAAAELGLAPGTPVGAGLIDAHAGGLGSIGSRSVHGTPLTRMAYVFGTSACTMASGEEPIFIPGVWGPYFSAMAPGLWLSEGGQSAAGAAIEQLIAFHPAWPELKARAAAEGLAPPEWCAGQAAAKSPTLSDAVRLAGPLQVVPDFLGNRSPHAEPQARALVAGLGMERDLDHLVALYVAGVLGVGYGLRQIIDVSRARGATIEALALSGGAGRNPLVRQLLADCAGLPALASDGADPVLRGAAMLGAVAGGVHANLHAAMDAMSPDAVAYEPVAGDLAQVHQQRYAAFERLERCAREAMLTDLASPASNPQGGAL
ncbi:FGGY-family carbohydrate kinase [Alsobacter sp. KACC 23698]|uniref:FGGY-family carbohydrate kinase n=1 Tax=Alsobacter sp. KACC 23698 TaxID=3149229 RepID=A0AAU7JM31_9HYPH